MQEYQFTKVAEEVLETAASEAKRLGQTYKGTEHILLGLIKVPSIVSDLLDDYGVTEEKVNKLIGDLVAISASAPYRRKRKSDWTPKAEELIDIAFQEMQRGNLKKIGTENLMVAMLCHDDSIARRILHSLNFDDDKFVVELFQAMGEDGLTYLDEYQNGPSGPIGTPTIERFSRDMTELAFQGKLEHLVGREVELDRLIRTISRKTKNNPCLIGEPGVGKTAIVEGLATRMAKGNVPDTLKNKRLLSLDLAAMVAGTKYRGEFEERMEKVIAEAAADGDVLLFLDEIHTLIGAGGSEGALDAANILKPALSRGQIQIIGATTVDEYRKRIEKDPALERRFQPILVEESTEEETLEILEGIKEGYEKHHGVVISEDAIQAAVQLSARYINDRFMPDKAIDVLDEAAAKARLKRKKNSKKEIVITEKEIAGVISEQTKIPLNKLTETETNRLRKLESVLHKRIIAQDEAVSAIASAVRRGRVGLKDPSRPIGSFLFLGPTGVGKTELARALAEALFGRDDALIRVDMSEYMESHSVSKLIGSPPGYVGYDEGGQLSEKIRRNPYCVLLFDEIEKAHPDIYHVLLQILDDGHITDAQGRKIDFKNTIIIMTSNAGAEKIVAPKKLGFSADESEEANYAKMREGVMDEIKKIFKPELLNRIDEIQVFHALSEADVKKVLKLQIKELAARVKMNMGITLSVQAAAEDFLMKKGFDPKYGARPLRRAIQTNLEDELALAVLAGDIKAGDAAVASFDKKNKKIKIARE